MHNVGSFLHKLAAEYPSINDKFQFLKYKIRLFLQSHQSMHNNFSQNGFVDSCLWRIFLKEFRTKCPDNLPNLQFWETLICRI